MNSLLPYPVIKRMMMPLLLLSCLLLYTTYANGQEKPPKPIMVTVSTAQHLQFGSFIQTGNNGSVTVAHTGARTAEGSIILPNISSSAFPTPALFVVEALPGTLITILNGPDVYLSGSKGGTMRLTIGESSTRSPFITRGRYTDVFIGGTLTIGSLTANPAGSYSGTFQVTFIQE